MSLTSGERAVLADLRDELSRSDPRLAESFHRLLPPPGPSRWLAGAVAAIVLAAAAVIVLGLVVVGALATALVLGSPVVVAVAVGSRTPDGPREE